MNLSDKQQKVLDAIRKNGKARYIHDMGRFGGGYWYVLGVGGRCSPQIKSLLRKGLLIQKQVNTFGDKEAYIKEYQ